jgi:hypothetical protein
MSTSNCTKVHPGRNPGPRSVPKCGISKFDPSNRYVHFFQKALDQPELEYFFRKKNIPPLEVAENTNSQFQFYD